MEPDGRGGRVDGVTIYYELIGQGRKVSAQDDKLKIRPSHGLTEAMKEAVRTHKAEILAAMQEAEELDELLSLGDGLWEPDWRQRLEALC